MLDTLNRETIMQKRIKVYDEYRYKEIAHLNPYYPYRIFAMSRRDGSFLKNLEINMICRFMLYYLTDPVLSISEIMFRLGTGVVENFQQLYDMFDKLDIDTKNITRTDRTIMYIYCNANYNFETTKEIMIRTYFSKEGIDDVINHALEVFGVDGLIWHDDINKFVYDNYIIYYQKYDQNRNSDMHYLEELVDTKSQLGDNSYFFRKNIVFKMVEERQGTDFILENYYDAYERKVTQYGGYPIMRDSLQRNEDEIKVEDVQWLVEHEWALGLIQREMGFSSRYALKRYLDKYNIDYSKCKKRPGRPRGTFKNGSARNQIYEDFTKGLVPDTIYDKYKDKYSKRSIDRIYVEWKEDQKPLFD